MRRLMNILLWVLIASFTLAGCGGGQDPSRMPQDTPRRALEKMERAVEVGNTEAFLECWEATPEQRDLLSATMDMVVARRNLEEAAVETFGKQAWESAGRKYGMKQQPKDPIGMLKFDRMEVSIEGDNATVTSGQEKPRKLVRRDGVWRVTSVGLSEGEALQRTIDMMKGMRAAMTAALAEVKRGASARAVRRKLLVESLKAVLAPAIEATKQELEQQK